MTWKGAHPIVSLVKETYDTGVHIAKAAFKTVESRLQRGRDLPKYEVLIKLEFQAKIDSSPRGVGC